VSDRPELTFVAKNGYSARRLSTMKRALEPRFRRWRLPAAPVGFDAINPWLAAARVAIDLRRAVQFLTCALLLIPLQ
jgi:hypothetical protein